MADTYNVTIVGNLTNNNGVLSGFSSSNYATTNESITLTSSSTFEIVIKVITGNTINTTGNAIMSYYDSRRFAIAVNSSAKAELAIGNGSSWVQIIQGTTTIQTNSTYYIKTLYNGTSYELYLSTDGATWNKEATYTSTQVIPSMEGLNIGVSRVIDEYVWLGSIDLNSCYIKINNNLVWEGVTPEPTPSSGGLKFGTLNVVGAYYGADTVEKIYMGTELVYSGSTPTKRKLYPTSGNTFTLSTGEKYVYSGLDMDNNTFVNSIITMPADATISSYLYNSENVNRQFSTFKVKYYKGYSNTYVSDIDNVINDTQTASRGTVDKTYNNTDDTMMDSTAWASTSDYVFAFRLEYNFDSSMIGNFSQSGTTHTVQARYYKNTTSQSFSGFRYYWSMKTVYYDADGNVLASSNSTLPQSNTQWYTSTTFNSEADKNKVAKMVVALAYTSSSSGNNSVGQSQNSGQGYRLGVMSSNMQYQTFKNVPVNVTLLGYNTTYTQGDSLSLTTTSEAAQYYAPNPAIFGEVNFITDTNDIDYIELEDTIIT